MPITGMREDNIIGIGELCYRLGCSRSQFFNWRRDPGFPPVKTTKYGLKGYYWPSVVQWLIDNRHRLRRCAGRPSLDELAAGLRMSTRDDVCGESATSGLEDVLDRVAEPEACAKLSPTIGERHLHPTINGPCLPEPDASDP